MGGGHRWVSGRVGGWVLSQTGMEWHTDKGPYSEEWRSMYARHGTYICFTYRSAIGCRRILDDVVDDMWRSGGSEQRKPETGMLLAAAQHHFQFLAHFGLDPSSSCPRSVGLVYFFFLYLVGWPLGVVNPPRWALFLVALINSRFGLGQLHLHSDWDTLIISTLSTTHTHNMYTHTHRHARMTDLNKNGLETLLGEFV